MFLSFTAIYVLAGEAFKVIVPSFLALLAYLQARRNKEKMDEAESKMHVTAMDVVTLKDGVKELKITVDGRLSQLLALTESAAFARGIKQEGDRAK